jgi:thiosulfate/3-mercaptopyruvate sulfurtransferase
MPLTYRGIMPPVLRGPAVTTQWLADHLGSDDLVILDATVLVVRSGPGELACLSGRDRYLRDGHIPGALFADLLGDFGGRGGRLSSRPPGRDAFERAAAAVGVRESSTIVVYDSAGGAWASCLSTLFRGYGVDTVAVLDGGLSAWLAEGRETDTGSVTPRWASGR